MSGSLFSAVNSEDDDVQRAYTQASESIEDFVELVKSDVEAIYMAKLSFRDPILSEQRGEDQFLYIWLSDIYDHITEDVLSGGGEVPKALTAWHQVGQRLAFEIDDAFDWMVIKDGRAEGGFTLRAHRKRLATEVERKAYDETYESL